MDAIKKAFQSVKEDMEKMRREIEQVKDIQGVILDKIGVEAAALDIEETEEELEDEDVFDDECAEDEDMFDEEDSEDELEEDDTEEESSVIEGKFIATKTGKRYHVLSCNLVKNIAEKNKLMFNSEEEAEEEGLLKCHCVKN